MPKRPNDRNCDCAVGSSHRTVVALDAETQRLIRYEDECNFIGPYEEIFKPLRFTCAVVVEATVSDFPEISHPFKASAWFGDGSKPFELCCEAPRESFSAGLIEAMRLESGRPLGLCSAEKCRALVDYLWELTTLRNAALVTFNGVSFDLRVLAVSCDSALHSDRCKQMALASYDPCLQVMCERGFPIGLDASCRGMGLKSKSGSGADAPEEWVSGDPKRMAGVVEYCAEDVRATLGLFGATRKGIRWISKAGKLAKHEWRAGAPATALDCILSPFPDMSWAKPTPDAGELPPRLKFVEWIGKAE